MIAPPRQHNHSKHQIVEAQIRTFHRSEFDSLHNHTTSSSDPKTNEHSRPGRPCGTTIALNQEETRSRHHCPRFATGLSAATWALRCCRGWTAEAPPNHPREVWEYLTGRWEYSQRFASGNLGARLVPLFGLVENATLSIQSNHNHPRDVGKLEYHYLFRLSMDASLGRPD